MNKNRVAANLLKVSCFILSALIMVAVVYVLYVLLSYKRIEDHVSLEVEGESKDWVAPGQEYKIAAYNIGFGAYTREFSFFMDGGKYSVAKDKETVNMNTVGAARLLKSFHPDFVMLQEVDLDSTRSWHVNQYELISKEFPDYVAVKAINYDSAFLFYPFLKPHGRSKSSIITYSKYKIESSIRRSLPVETGFNKFLDLDRCFSVSRIPVENGSYLILINLHLSAYSDNEAVRRGQREMLFETMKEEYAAGNYVIVGGDFNHDLPGDSVSYFNEDSSKFSWAAPFPAEDLPEGFCRLLQTTRPLIPTARNTDEPYDPATTFVCTIDGFLISDNIKCISLENVDNQFEFSDHNPVVLSFQIKE